MWQFRRIAVLHSTHGNPPGTNDLKIYRRHASYCTRYSSLKNKPDNLPAGHEERRKGRHLRVSHLVPWVPC
jgi:hypothetical protein